MTAGEWLTNAECWLLTFFESPRCALFGHHGTNRWVRGAHQWDCSRCSHSIRFDLPEDAD